MATRQAMEKCLQLGSVWEVQTKMHGTGAYSEPVTIIISAHCKYHIEFYHGPDCPSPLYQSRTLGQFKEYKILDKEFLFVRHDTHTTVFNRITPDDARKNAEAYRKRGCPWEDYSFLNPFYSVS